MCASNSSVVIVSGMEGKDMVDKFPPGKETLTPETSIRSRGTANPAVDAEPITQLEIVPRTVATGGRPRKLKRMPMLSGLTPAEEILFNDFIEEILQEYPDISPSDYRDVWLAAGEYIKYIRVIDKELKTGKVLSMARQHPGTQMRALRDQLDINRKARIRGKQPQEGEDAQKLRDVLYQLGRN